MNAGATKRLAGDSGNEGGAGKPVRKIRRSRLSYHKARYENLKRLMKDRFGDDVAEATRQLGKSHNYLWQLLNRYRSIGEDTARFIERKLGLEDKILDEPLGVEQRRTCVMNWGPKRSFMLVMVPKISVESLANKARKRKAVREATQFVGMVLETPPAMENANGGIKAGTIYALHKEAERIDVVIDESDTVLTNGEEYLARIHKTEECLILTAHEVNLKRYEFSAGHNGGKRYSESEVTVIGRVRGWWKERKRADKK